MRYAIGAVWYGEEHLFGAETILYKSEEMFSFNYSAGGYNGYTVELIKQANGNLATQQIDIGQF
jgi:hypothetical protein